MARLNAWAVQATVSISQNKRHLMSNDKRFLKHSGAEHPIICGPMYPCSNPELVAAVSAAGGLGIIQPISLTYVHGYSFKSGLSYIQSLTDKPVGMNLLIEGSSRKYRSRMENWLNIALEEGINFFITSMGKPDWVVKLVHDAGAFVYHDVTESKWAEIASDAGVDGLIAVNNKAGGHAGRLNSEQLLSDLKRFKLPIVCAGGVADVNEYRSVLKQGYQAVQMGTRFIATKECNASTNYKQAIIQAHASDIVLSERITGVPVSVINNAYVQRKGLTPNKIERLMLKHPKLKHLMRMLLALQSLYSLKRSLKGEQSTNDYWQAGKSVETIDSILSVQSIINSYTE